MVGSESPRPAGLFAGGGPRSVVVLTRTVPRGARVAVSLEPAGGVPELTGSMLFRARTE